MEFKWKGGFDAGKSSINELKLFYHVTNIGDAKSLAIHSASTAHSQPARRAQSGSVRLSVGIKQIEDIIVDLQQALATAERSQLGGMSGLASRWRPSAQFRSCPRSDFVDDSIGDGLADSLRKTTTENERKRLLLVNGETKTKFMWCIEIGRLSVTTDGPIVVDKRTIARKPRIVRVLIRVRVVDDH
jgi:hypothetical protein